MVRNIFLLAIMLPGLTIQAQNSIKKIAFGSCSHEYDDDQMWPEITNEKADLFIWTGDIIYGDSPVKDTLAAKYTRQKNRPSYQEMIAQTPVIGIWDDHDYGIDDGGKHFSQKRESKEALLEFLDVPKDNPVRNHEGMYNSYIYGVDGKRVKIILLDCRYFRDTLEVDNQTSARYKQNLEGDVLGKKQWQWLQKELSENIADLNIIVSGIQILANEHGFEKWGNFPKSRTRLIELIEDLSPNPTLFISGDRHIAELSKLETQKLDYPLFDFTSSGLTHTWGRHWEEKNELRVGDLIIQKNYGLLEIEWPDGKPKVNFIVKGKNGAEYQRHTHQF